MAFVVTIYKNKEFGYVKKYYCLWLISPEIQDVLDFVVVIVEMFLKKGEWCSFLHSYTGGSVYTYRR